MFNLKNIFYKINNAQYSDFASGGTIVHVLLWLFVCQDKTTCDKVGNVL